MNWDLLEKKQKLKSIIILKWWTKSNNFLKISDQLIKLFNYYKYYILNLIQMNDKISLNTASINSRGKKVH